MSLNPPIKNWHGKCIWIIGASSGIGYALAERFALLGASLFLSARSLEPLEKFTIGHQNSTALPLDVTDVVALKDAYDQIINKHPIDLIVYCAGYYSPMRAQDFDLQVALKHMNINYFGALNLLNACLPNLTAQKAGHLSFVSSVAGFSGLPKSMAYGPTKAALTHLAEVLYLDLNKSNIGVSVIHPGFVKTPLTSQNDFEMPAIISAEQAAIEIVKGFEKGEFDIHFPKRFSLFLKFLRVLPYRLYFAIISRSTGL